MALNVCNSIGRGLTSYPTMSDKAVFNPLMLVLDNG